MRTKDKHILIVTSEFPPQPGGIGSHAYNLTKNLCLNGFEVDVITDYRSFSGEEERHFDNNLNFKIHRITRTKLRLVMYLKRIIFLFKLIRNSGVVIASGKYSLWIVAFSSLFYKRKFIAVIHGTEVNFNHKLLKISIDRSLKRFSKIIAVSNYTKSLIAPVIQKKVVVIPNGIDVSKWDALNNGKLELKGYPKIITVGNITERKGQLNVIKHVPELIKVYSQLHYHCVGIPTKKVKFLKAATGLKVDSYITFHGRVSDEKLQQLVQSCDVFVMLSSPTTSGDVEGYGIAIIEANYLGLPSIGARDCGIEDAISNNKSGILIPYNDSSAFLNALNEVLSEYENYRFEAKQWALQHTWDLIIKHYIKALNF